MSEDSLPDDEPTVSNGGILREQLRQILSEAEESGQVDPARLQVESKDRATISLPEAVSRPLLALLLDLAEGRAVSVADADEELTTREAADLLNVPHLTQLLKEGKIPSRKSGPTTASIGGTC